jgi:arylsulfatase A-like enzyme
MHTFRPLALFTGLVTLLLSSTGSALAQTPQRYNVLILLADDLGVDQLSMYQPGTTPTPANTPNLDLLAAQGVRFDNAYAMPLCSPTRACLMTGRYGFRTGIGTNVRSNSTATHLGPMSTSEITLPEMLDAAGSGYLHAAVGKWHLGYHQFLAINGNPLSNGFEHFAGTKGNFATRTNPPQNFTQWPKTVDGFTQNTTTFATVDNVDEALAFAIAQGTNPFLCYVAFNAPHVPLVRPPGFSLPHSSPIAGEAWWP